MSTALQQGTARGQEGYYTRTCVATEIQKLIVSCYRFGINPLSTLRKSFSQFEWEYLDLSSPHFEKGRDEAVARIVKWRDIFWLHAGHNSILVTANRRGVVSNRWSFFGSSKFDSEHPNEPDFRDWVAEIGAKEILDRNPR